MTTKKTAKTTKGKRGRVTTVQMLKLDGVKVNRRCVYLEKSEGLLRVGPAGTGEYPLDMAMNMPAGDRRRFRKALRNAGHGDLANATVPRSQRELNREYAQMIADQKREDDADRRAEQAADDAMWNYYDAVAQ